eukprot:9070681-Ditylum_brightwellii.AAC.1
MIHDVVEVANNKSTIKVPMSCLQTYQGALITARHMLKIKVTMSGIFATCPEIKVPLHIGT